MATSVLSTRINTEEMGKFEPFETEADASYVMTDKITTIRKSGLSEKIGGVDSKKRREIEMALASSIGVKK
jgi:mRNA-degrading endonuclease toxin of MazEF toxin-antitoxin module